MKISRTIALASLAGLFLLSASAIFADTPVDLAAARATDPNTLGWMVGSPPPPDKLIRFDDGTFYRFPQWRWSFSHWRELLPTVAVPRGAGPTQQFTSALRSDLDAVTFVPMGVTAPMTWADSLVANYTDGIVVLHRGRIADSGFGDATVAQILDMTIYVDPKAEMVIALRVASVGSERQPRSDLAACIPRHR